MIIDYLHQSLGEGTPHDTRKGLQYSFNCPFCGDTRERFFVNVDRQLVYCHNCEYGATITTFIADYAHISYKDALITFREYEGYSKPLSEDLETEIYEKLIKVPIIEPKKYIHPLPEEFVLIEHATGKAGNQAIKYLKSRGITLSMCERYYIGYCAEGHYANRIIMPDFEDGDLIYWQARTWEPKPKKKSLARYYRKVLNPSLTHEQIQQGIIDISKSEVISNIDMVLQDGIAVICEGKMDAYTIGNYGACTHGKHMSDIQFVKLVSNKDRIHTIVIMYDGDAFKNTLTTAKRLYQYFDNVLVCHLNKEEDPNDLGTKGCLKAINEAIPYSPLFEMKARIKGWC